MPGVYARFIHGFGLSCASGQTHAQRFMPELLTYILEGRPDRGNHHQKLSQSSVPVAADVRTGLALVGCASGDGVTPFRLG